MTADWVRAIYFNSPEDYAETVSVLLGAYGKLKDAWQVDCTIKIKCWTKSCTAYWTKKVINIGMQIVGYDIQENRFLEWKNAEYLLEEFSPCGLQIPEIVMVHEYAHIIAGQLHGDKCNHGPLYQEIYAVMLDDHFSGIRAVKKFEEKHPTIHYGKRR